MIDQIFPVMCSARVYQSVFSRRLLLVPTELPLPPLPKKKQKNQQKQNIPPKIIKPKKRARRSNPPTTLRYSMPSPRERCPPGESRDIRAWRSASGAGGAAGSTGFSKIHPRISWPLWNSFAKVWEAALFYFFIFFYFEPWPGSRNGQVLPKQRPCAMITPPTQLVNASFNFNLAEIRDRALTPSDTRTPDVVAKRCSPYFTLSEKRVIKLVCQYISIHHILTHVCLLF